MMKIYIKLIQNSKGKQLQCIVFLIFELKKTLQAVNSQKKNLETF